MSEWNCLKLPSSAHRPTNQPTNQTDGRTLITVCGNNKEAISRVFLNHWRTDGRRNPWIWWTKTSGLICFWNWIFALSRFVLVFPFLPVACFLVPLPIEANKWNFPAWSLTFDSKSSTRDTTLWEEEEKSTGGKWWEEYRPADCLPPTIAAAEDDGQFPLLVPTNTTR